MGIYADLHIHSCLSPCADNDMTPHNICAMASIKGLNVIAITDHNTTKNLKAFNDVVGEYGLMLLPGIEVTTKEEVHILGYFSSIDDSINAGEVFLKSLSSKVNLPDIFGHQFIIDNEDEIIGEEPSLLIGNTEYSIAEVCQIIENNNGVAVPAHVNRGNNGLLINQGIFPEKPYFNTIEYSRNLAMPEDELLKRHVLISSDSHYLGNILEKEFSLPMNIKSINDIIQWMRSSKNI